MPRILLVEDDIDVSDAIEWHLRLPQPANLKNVQLEAQVTGYFGPD